jgi:hypothetical protein
MFWYFNLTAAADLHSVSFTSSRRTKHTRPSRKPISCELFPRCSVCATRQQNSAHFRLAVAMELCAVQGWPERGD